jgi:hypothetical protein
MLKSSFLTAPRTAQSLKCLAPPKTTNVYWPKRYHAIQMISEIWFTFGTGCGREEWESVPGQTLASDRFEPHDDFTPMNGHFLG